MFSRKRLVRSILLSLTLLVCFFIVRLVYATSVLWSDEGGSEQLDRDSIMFEEQVRFAKGEVHKHPDSPEAHITLANALHNVGEYESEAKEQRTAQNLQHARPSKPK